MRLLFKTMRQRIILGWNVDYTESYVFKIEMIQHEAKGNYYILKLTRKMMLRNFCSERDFEFACNANEINYINENNLMCLWDIMNALDKDVQYYRLSYHLRGEDSTPIITNFHPIHMSDLKEMSATYNNKHKYLVTKTEGETTAKSGQFFVAYKCMDEPTFYHMSEDERKGIARTLLKELPKDAIWDSDPVSDNPENK